MKMNISKLASTWGMTTLLLCGCAVTPEALTPDEVRQESAADLDTMFIDQEPVSGPISLYEAIARAVKYNLDHRLKMMEDTLARKQLDLIRYDQLPELTTSAGYYSRDNFSGGTSIALTGPDKGSQSLIASTSSEKQVRDVNGILVWNLLDFGVSYVRAQQQSKEVLITEERRRKVVQNIVQDVRYAYWRAVSAQHLLDKMDDLLDRTYAALKDSRQLEKLRLQAPIQSLSYQKALLEIIQDMWLYRRELETARTELAALMNLKPGTPYTVVDPEGDLALPATDRFGTLDTLEERALLNRPELMEERYQLQISSMEVKKAMLEMLPGLEFNLGGRYNSNKLLWENSWTEAGVNISWNLFQIFSGPANKRVAETQVELDNARRLALSMAVITQVHLAYQRYHIALSDFEVTRDLVSVEKRIQQHMEAEQRAAVENELEVIRSMASSMSAQMQHDLGYAEVQNSIGRILNSVGVDPLPGVDINQDVSTLAAIIEKQLSQKSL
ncbi:MAG: TolC family protein [Gammaproteobacteria bacterium]